MNSCYYERIGKVEYYKENFVPFVFKYTSDFRARYAIRLSHFHSIIPVLQNSRVPNDMINCSINRAVKLYFFNAALISENIDWSSLKFYFQFTN